MTLFLSWLEFENIFFNFFFRLFDEKILILLWKKCLEIRLGIFISKRFWRFCLEVRVGAVPKKARESTESEESRREGSPQGGLGRRVRDGSAESEAEIFIQVIPRRITCRDLHKCVYVLGRRPIRIVPCFPLSNLCPFSFLSSLSFFQRPGVLAFSRFALVFIVVGITLAKLLRCICMCIRASVVRDHLLIVRFSRRHRHGHWLHYA